MILLKIHEKKIRFGSSITNSVELLGWIANIFNNIFSNCDMYALGNRKLKMYYIDIPKGRDFQPKLAIAARSWQVSEIIK